ncbi:YibE/F family protein [Candidatus Peregrinibacteria bacterium]|nr:MAG: YibE/F family protein [Candidatus Peregrinibacteria bacterium]
MPNQYNETFFRGKVLQILNESAQEQFGFVENKQEISVTLLDGDEAGQVVEIDHFISPIQSLDSQKLNPGQTIVLTRNNFQGENAYQFFEPYRLNSLGGFMILFVLITVAVARVRGITSLLGLAVTLVILLKWMLPQIMAGANPVITSVISAFAIAIITLYLAHGFSRRTTLSVISTLITLLLSFLLAMLAVSGAQLFGLGSEEAAYLSFGQFQNLDLRGLLLGAIVIGALGVLDDITTAQTAVVDELKKADHRFRFKELYHRGLSVGKEHITSLVNTLVIAYVGASLPVFLLLVNSDRPLWVILNNEFMAEEIIRTLVGSTTLVLAVPISTAIAAYAYAKKSQQSL